MRGVSTTKPGMSCWVAVLATSTHWSINAWSSCVTFMRDSILELHFPSLPGIERAEAHMLVDLDHIAVRVGVEGIDSRHGRLVLPEEAKVLHLHQRAEAVTAVIGV